MENPPVQRSSYALSAQDGPDHVPADVRQAPLDSVVIAGKPLMVKPPPVQDRVKQRTALPARARRRQWPCTAPPARLYPLASHGHVPVTAGLPGPTAAHDPA